MPDPVSHADDHGDGLAARAAAIHWYHSMELAPGVVTDGVFDLRGQAHHYRLPARLDGLRCLDVGALNGFWAFEMERRGAREVVAIDIDSEDDLDWPPRRSPRRQGRPPTNNEGLRLGMGRPGFELAREAYGSCVQRRVVSVYDALPEDLGQFDLVFCGSVLIHLRDALLALERLADLTAPGGMFISAEEYDPWIGLAPAGLARFRGSRPSAPVFWQPSVRAWKQMILYAGYEHVSDRGRFVLETTEGWSVRHAVLHAYRTPPPGAPSGRLGRVRQRLGDRVRSRLRG